MDHIISAAEKGHSFALLGQAGTGKTYIIKQIASRLKRTKCVQMTASTGIAAAALCGRTIHSFLGIRDSRYETNELATKIKNEVDFREIKQHILQTDTLIIDEISMLSRATFLQIEGVTRAVRGEPFPFGGIQVILAGDFFQLKPVPNLTYQDPGDLLLVEDTLKKLVPHHFVLTTVHRQKEEDLTEAVHEISRGITCSDRTKELMKELNRPLPSEGKAIRLFALNYDVQRCNSDHLLDMDGDVKIYRSQDGGKVQDLHSCRAQQDLHLKVGAPVILLVNLSDTLVNGRRGVVRKLESDHVKVDFEGIKETTDIHPYSFTVSKPDKTQSASRRQIPLNLAFALTVHKAQGMTIECLEVDCRNMSLPGQLGVAIGRATCKSGLRVTNFKESLIQSQPAIITDYYNSTSATLLDRTSCCRTISLEEHPSGVCDTEPVCVDEPVDELDDNESDREMLEFMHFYESRAEIEDIGESLPSWVNTVNLLDKLYFDIAITADQKQINEHVTLLKQRPENMTTFCTEIFNKIKILFDGHLNIEESSISSKLVTEFYGDFHKLMSSPEYVRSVQKLFEKTEPSSLQFRIAYGLTEDIRSKIVEMSTEQIKAKEMMSAEHAKGKEFTSPSGGEGTLRYIAGWCVGTLRHRKRGAVTRNLYKKASQSRSRDLHSEVILLDSLVSTMQSLEELSDCKESLQEIKRRDNLRGSLCKVNDDTFRFFKELDAVIRRNETMENVAVHGQDVYNVIRQKLCADVATTRSWSGLFTDLDNVELARVHVLKEEVISKYLTMSCSQFRKDYLQELKVTKKEAHRKQILMREQKKQKKPSEPEKVLADKPSTSSGAPKAKQPKVPAKRKGKQGKGKMKAPKKIDWPCGGCQNECVVDCVACDRCNTWYHYQCVGLYGDEKELEEDEWYCTLCKTEDV